MLNRRSILALSAATGVVPSALWAQAYPARPLKLLVGFAAGGITDLTARALAEEMGTALGQPVVVDNRAGAGGNIASAELARAAPDGYTLMLASPGQLVVNPLIQKSLGFDPNTQFSLIGLTNASPFVLVVPANSRFRSASELLDWGKANPGKLSFGSPGIGTTMHIGGEMLNAVVGLQAVHVPYRGGAQATADLVAGRLDFMVDSLGAVSAQIDAGQLKVLASASAKRHARFPDAPALRELYPQIELSSWLGVVAPPNLPPALLRTLAAALDKAVKAPRYVDFVTARGSTVVDASSQAFAVHLQSERERVRRTVADRGLQLD